MAKAVSKKEKLSEKSTSEVCTIAAQTTIKGDISAPGNIRLEGTIDGNVNCNGKLVMASQAKINGNITCLDLITEGNVLGDVTAQNSIHLLSTAVLNGNIITQTIAIDEGGVFNGQCKIQ